MFSPTNKLCIDCSSISGGGGKTQLEAFFRGVPLEMYDSVVVLIQKALVPVVPRGIQILIAPSSSSLRFIYQQMVGWYLQSALNVAASHTPFGIGVRFSKEVKTIINVALPIICYDDSPFWSDLSPAKRLKNRVKTRLRRHLIVSRADKILCENELMHQRLTQSLNCRTESISILPPLRSEIVAQIEKTTHSPKRGFNLLYVTGEAFHKNVRFLKHFCDENERWLQDNEITFRITTTGDSSQVLNFIGPKFGNDLIEEYSVCDALVNVSDLESISNNFMEAHAAKKPMLLNDTDFSKFCVRTPYVVVDVRSFESLKVGLLRLINANTSQPSKTTPLTLDAKTRFQRLLDFYED